MVDKPPRPGTYPCHVSSSVGRFLSTLSWGVPFSPRLLSCVVFTFRWGLLRCPCRPPLAVFFLLSFSSLPLFPRPSPLFVGVRRCYLRSLFFSFFNFLLTALLSTPPFSVGSRLGRPFCRPACFWSLRGQAVASPAFFASLPLPLPLAPWFRLGFTSFPLAVFFTARSLPWPPSVCAASLATIYAAFMAAKHAGSLVALCAAFLGRSVCRLDRSTCRSLGRSLCRLLARSLCRLLARSLCRLLSRSLCRLLHRLVRRLLDCSVCRLPDCSTCLLLARSTCRFLDHSGRVSPRGHVYRLPLPFGGVFFSARFLTWPFPLATSLDRFFLLRSSRSRLRVAPSSWVFSHVWPYRHGDTGTACTSTGHRDLSAIGNEA